MINRQTFHKKNLILLEAYTNDLHNKLQAGRQGAGGCELKKPRQYNGCTVIENQVTNRESILSREKQYISNKNKVVGYLTLSGLSIAEDSYSFERLNQPRDFLKPFIEIDRPLEYHPAKKITKKCHNSPFLSLYLPQIIVFESLDVYPIQIKQQHMSAEVVSCSKSITIHSLESRNPISNFTYHRGIVNSVSINHNNKVVASCGQDGKIFLVNAEKTESKLMEHNFYTNNKDKPVSLNTCSFSPNSKYLAVGSVDSLVKLWDLRAEKSQKDQSVVQIKSHMGAVSSFAWIRNLKGEAYGSQVLASSSTSGDIFIHSNKNGEFSQINYLKMQEGINCIRVSESYDFCRLAACTNGGTLAVWDLMGKQKQKPFWTMVPSIQHRPSITSLSFSPYSHVLLVTASVDQSLNFYDINQKKTVKKIAAEEPLNSVALHQNGQILVAGGIYGGLFVYDLRYPAKPQSKLIGHDTTVKHLQFYKAKEKDQVDNKIRGGSSVSSSSNLPEKKVQEPQRVKEVQRAPQLVNNFVNIQKPVQLEQKAKENILQAKPQRSQQVIKPSLPKRTEMVAQFKQSADSDFYRNRSKQPKQSIELGQMQSIRKEMKEIKEAIGVLKSSHKQVKDQIYEMEERLNYSIVKQFQLHQQEMTKIIEGLLNRDEEREKLIKKLQEENKALKKTTF